nr:MAG TPA: hypothetical protein [Herelleviridae sp.]
MITKSLLFRFIGVIICFDSKSKCKNILLQTSE